MNKEIQSRDEEILELRFAGLSYKQIGDKFGVTKQRIQQLFSPPAAIRRYVVEKANGKCEICGIQVGNRGDVHHRHAQREDFNDIANLQLLCRSCHMQSHKLPGKGIQTICDCGAKMHKAGFGWSGKYRTQRWRCPVCGKVLQRKDENRENYNGNVISK